VPSNPILIGGLLSLGVIFPVLGLKVHSVEAAGQQSDREISKYIYI